MSVVLVVVLVLVVLVVVFPVVLVVRPSSSWSPCSSASDGSVLSGSVLSRSVVDGPVVPCPCPGRAAPVLSGSPSVGRGSLSVDGAVGVPRDGADCSARSARGVPP